MIFNRGEVVELANLPGEVRRQDRREVDDLSLKTAVSRLEKEYIRKALIATGGNQTQAARLLEISLRGMLYKIKEYGLEEHKIAEG